MKGAFIAERRTSKHLRRAVPVKKEREADSGKERLVDAKEKKPGRRERSRRRRRSKSNTKRPRSRHRSKRKEKKDKSGTPDPESSGIETTPEEKPRPSARAEEQEEQPEEELVQTEEEEQDDADTGNRLELKRAAKPSARKPLPRRPRSPSYSPPGYRDREDQKPKKWKGLKHVIRGQLYYNSGPPRRKGQGKGKGKRWHRK